MMEVRNKRRKFKKSVEVNADHQSFQGQVATNSLESGGKAWQVLSLGNYRIE
jgi:hypothetical protein